MNLQQYFETTSGKGVLATASSAGNVDVAIYSRPQVMADRTLAFIMRHRLTHSYLQENDQAAFMFMEDQHSFRGLRIFMKKIKEDQDPVLIEKLSRRHLSPEEDKARGPKSLVYFTVEKIVALVGGREIDADNIEV